MCCPIHALDSKPIQEAMSDLEILKQIENSVGRPLKPCPDDKGMMDWESKDCYLLNDQKEMIALNLAGCYLESIDFLKPIITLTQLNLSNNQLTDISVLKELKNLTQLDLWNNKLTDISVLKELKNLTQLNLSSNPLTDISVLKELKNLTQLNLSNNQLTDLSVLKELKNLTQLNLSNNSLTDISVLKELKNLTQLDLWDNQLTDISVLKELKNLARLDLRTNRIKILPEWLLEFNLPIKWESEYQREIYLEGNPLEQPPPEIIKQGNVAIKAYFDSLKEPQRPLNELKVLFVGDGGAGKTSLSKVLRDEAFDETESQTHGINIHHWQQQDLILHCWDFGGQEIMHATHQFFLSKRSLYILVLDGRKEEDAEYWLKHIQSFGGDSPVLVVLNKTDEHPSFDLNRQHLLNKYSNIQGFYKLSCKNNIGLKEFKQGFNQAFKQVKMLQSTWGDSWFKVKAELENLTQHYITCEYYHEICKNNKVRDNHQETLAQYLHDLGIIVHFSDFELDDTHILEPRWITEAVYKIINSKQLADKQGLLCLTDLADILKNKNQKIMITHEKNAATLLN